MRELSEHMQQVLQSALGCSGKILLLSGPAGSGKTVAVRVLSRTKLKRFFKGHVHLIEWADEALQSNDIDSFEEFVKSVSRYGEVVLGQAKKSNHSSDRSVILLEVGLKLFEIVI